MIESAVVLTPLHYAYLIGVIVILAVMVLKKDTPAVCIAFLFILGVSFAYVPACSHRGTVRHSRHTGSPDCRRRVRHYRRPYHQEDTKVLPASDCRHGCVYHWSVSLPTAINYMAGGAGQPTYGAWQNWVVAIFTLVVVHCAEPFCQGIPETGIHSYGYDCRLYLLHVLWHGKLWKCG